MAGSPNGHAANERVPALLAEHGPMTGQELRDKSGAGVLALWRFCSRDASIGATRVGRRYLRLDKNVAGYGRLSPSIKREFLTYTVLSLPGDEAAREARAKEMTAECREISQAKIRLAEERISLVVASLPFMDEVLDGACFVIAGDVVYDMAHRVPRPETSTGRMVNGSDLDVIVVTDDGFDKELAEQLDDAIYRDKYQLLVLPQYREELDYLIKDLNRVREQVRFDDFKHMVACKILHEGDYLYGSRRVFDTLKGLVAEAGVPEKLGALEKEAIDFRAQAEAELLANDGDLSEMECWKLFYTQAEQDEIY